MNKYKCEHKYLNQKEATRKVEYRVNMNITSELVCMASQRGKHGFNTGLICFILKPAALIRDLP